MQKYIKLKVKISLCPIVILRGHHCQKLRVHPLRLGPIHKLSHVNITLNIIEFINSHNFLNTNGITQHTVHCAVQHSSY